MQPQHSSTPINTLISKIIADSFAGSLGQTKCWLNELKNKKNLQPNKMGEYIHNSLKDTNLDFQGTFHTLMNLGDCFSHLGSRDSIKVSIFSGFTKYLSSSPISDQEKTMALSNIHRVDTSFLGEYVKFFQTPSFPQDRQQDILYQAQRLFTAHTYDDFKRGLKIIWIFKLQQFHEICCVVDFIAKNIETVKFKEIKFYFDDQYQYQKLLISYLANQKRKEADKFAVGVIELYKIDPDTFSELMDNLNERGLAYNYRTYPLYVFEDKFSSYPEYMCFLVRFLLQSYRGDVAKFIVRKYNLQGHKLLRDVQQQLQKQQAVLQVNVLSEWDAFGATQLRVLGEDVDYLELYDFGLEEKDVVFVDSNNSELETIAAVLCQSQFIGLDMEMSGGLHSLSPPLAEIIQLATQDKVFVFDIPSLKNNQVFVKMLETIFFEESTQVVIGHGYTEDVRHIHKIVKTDKRMRTLYDTQKNSSKKNISLKDLVNETYKRPFSKFQQCSGWNNRPLRKAQIHYAALDAMVLVKIYTKTPTIDNE